MRCFRQDHHYSIFNKIHPSQGLGKYSATRLLSFVAAAKRSTISGTWSTIYCFGSVFLDPTESEETSVNDWRFPACKHSMEAIDDLQFEKHSFLRATLGTRLSSSEHKPPSSPESRLDISQGKVWAIQVSRSAPWRRQEHGVNLWPFVSLCKMDKVIMHKGDSVGHAIDASVVPPNEYHCYIAPLPFQRKVHLHLYIFVQKNVCH